MLNPGLQSLNFQWYVSHGDKEQTDAVYEGTEPLTPKDIAEIVSWLTGRPRHLNVNRLEVIPVCQSWSPFAIYREILPQAYS